MCSCRRLFLPPSRPWARRRGRTPAPHPNPRAFPPAATFCPGPCQPPKTTPIRKSPTKTRALHQKKRGANTPSNLL
jgi:hypothetical protein